MVVLHRRVPGTRNRIRTVGVVACMAVAAALLPACSSGDASEPAVTQAGPMSETASMTGAGPTTDDAKKLVGTWQVGFGDFHTWRPDGTWYVEYEPGPPVDPWDYGTYTFDGTTLAFDEPSDPRECPNTHGTYTVTFVDADTVRMELIEDDCDTRAFGAFAGLKWTRVAE